MSTSKVRIKSDSEVPSLFLLEPPGGAAAVEEFGEVRLIQPSDNITVSPRLKVEAAL